MFCVVEVFERVNVNTGKTGQTEQDKERAKGKQYNTSMLKMAKCATFLLYHYLYHIGCVPSSCSVLFCTACARRADSQRIETFASRPGYVCKNIVNQSTERRQQHLSKLCLKEQQQPKSTVGYLGGREGACAP